MVTMPLDSIPYTCSAFLKTQYWCNNFFPHILFLHWFSTHAIVVSHATHAHTTAFATETRSQNHTHVQSPLHYTHLRAYQCFSIYSHTCSCTQKRCSLKKATFRDLFFTATQTGTLNTLFTSRYPSQENIHTLYSRRVFAFCSRFLQGNSISSLPRGIFDNLVRVEYL